MAKVLGKGLDALIKNYSTEENQRYIIGQIPLEKICPNPNQPRQKFDDDQMKELIQSIDEKGVIQPITVQEKKNGELYELSFGDTYSTWLRF